MQIIIIDTNDFEQRVLTFENPEEAPKNRGELIPLIQEDFNLNKASLTVVENGTTLVLNEAEIPKMEIVTIAINRVEKLKGGMSIPNELLPKSFNGYHANLKSLRALRDWAQEKNHVQLLQVVGNIPTNIKSNEVKAMVKQVLTIANGTAPVAVAATPVAKATEPISEKAPDLSAKLEAIHQDVRAILTILNDSGDSETASEQTKPDPIQEYLNSIQDKLLKIKHTEF